MTDPIIKYLVAECEFERMVDFNEKLGFENYHDFLVWNMQCIIELSADDRTMITGLCTRLNNNTFKMVDMEDCHEWTASAYYFNNNKQLCIVHPR